LISQLFKKSELAFPAAVFAVTVLVHGGTQAIAMDTSASETAEPQTVASLSDRLLSEISRKYPGTRVTIDSKVHWTRGDAATSEGRVSLLGETSRGEAMFAVVDAEGARTAEGWATFSAWQPARVAVKRVLPGQRLQADQFVSREINVASGTAHEVRGLILDPEASVGNLESRQSVLEGQMLLSSAVQRVPDVRRGDAVTVHLISNGLSLSTQGQAQESAYKGSQVKISASRSKRELVGTLTENGIVEVKL
jgi:flagella basal body P-ring formation protein FlgA